MIIIPGIYNAQTSVPGGNVQGQVITVGAILKVTERDRRPYPSDPGTPSEIWIDNTAGIGYICKEVRLTGTVWDRLDVLGDYIAFGDADPGPNIDITLGYRPGSLRYARNTQTLWICDNNTQGAAIWSVLGTGGGTISLETNGIPNGDQTLLNIVQGANMLITDDGFGNITFDATGGGVTSVTATAPLTSSGGATPDISTSRNTNKLIGRGTAGVGVMEEITLGTNLSLSGTTLNATGGGGIKSGNATQVSAGVYTTTISGVTSYTAGDTYIIKFDSQNDGDSTLNISSVGAVPIYKNTNVKLSSGDIKANQEITIVYDGTNFQAIGLVSSQLLAYVHNAEGAVISKGQVVYAYQATGNKMSVKLARADSDATSAKTIGMVYDSSIPIGGDGYIIIQGVIEGINTAAYSAGDTLYLSGTTFGGVTNVKPYAPIHLVYVGIVERSNAGNGQIYVRCQNGYELDEIHDVDLISTPPTNNQVLAYDSATTLWKNKSLVGSFGVTVDGVTAVIQVGTVGYVVMPYAGTITGWSITANVSGSIQFDVWKATSAIPILANTIISNAAFKPKLTSSNFATSTTLTSWTTTFLAGDVFGFYVDSASTIKNATLTIRTIRT